MQFLVVFADALHQPWFGLAWMDNHGINARVARNTFRKAFGDSGPPAIGQVGLANERTAQGDEIHLAV